MFPPRSPADRATRVRLLSDADRLLPTGQVNLAGGLVAAPELLLDPLGIEAARREQHIAVEPEVGELLDEPLVRVPDRGERHLDALLPHLLRRGGDALVEQRDDVGASGRVAARSATTRQSHGAKHDSAPVWHAGPAGSTRSRIASPSQSSRISTTASVLPEVAPLCQYSCRERLQNHASPLSRVRRSASSSIQASISTRPLAASCTIAGISSPGLRS